MSDIVARIPRHDSTDEQAQGGELATYRVAYREGLTLQNLLRHIYEEIDHTLAFRDYRCGYGICGSCRVKLNGKTVRSCTTLIKPGEVLLIEPLASEDVIRDVAVRMRA